MRMLIPILLMYARHTVRASNEALKPLPGSKPVKSGYIEKREFEYIRHGNQALLAGMDVATGEIIPLVRNTRTEQDFADWFDSMCWI